MSLFAGGAAWGNSIFVSPTGNDRNSGVAASTPLRTLATAADRAAPGDTVYLLPGQFNEKLAPMNSGEPGQPITYRSLVPGAAVISNVNVGIMLNSLAYIVIDGISVDGLREPPNATVNTFLAVQNSNHITIQNARFRRANGWAGVDFSGFYSLDGTYWQDMPKNTPRRGSTSFVTLQDSSIDDVGEYATPSGDAIQVAYGRVQHVLIQRTTVSHAGHDLVEFDGDYGVLQNNLFNNSYRDKVGGDAGYRSIEVQGSFNVVQRNLMEHARRGGGGYIAPLAMIRGNDNLVRQNVLYDGITYGLGVWCAAASPAVENLHIYNNTLYNVGGAAWAVYAYPGCEKLSHHAFLNNLVMNSRMNPGTPGGVVHGSTIPDDDVVFGVMGGNGVIDVGQGPTAQSVTNSNLFWPAGGGPAYVVLAGAGVRMPLSVATGKYPQLFSGNVVERPTFVTATPRALADFRLQSSSAGVAAGTFLTHAVRSAASSNRLSVQDSDYFTDGNGVMPGDTIELQGTNEQATIVAIDHPSHTLTLSTPITFTNGQGVALPYNGTAPDIGIGSVP